MGPASPATSSRDRPRDSRSWLTWPKDSKSPRERPSVFQYWGRASTFQSRRASRPFSVVSWAEVRAPQAAKPRRRDRPNRRAKQVRFMEKVLLCNTRMAGP